MKWINHSGFAVCACTRTVCVWAGKRRPGRIHFGKCVFILVCPAVDCPLHDIDWLVRIRGVCRSAFLRWGQKESEVEEERRFTRGHSESGRARKGKEERRREKLKEDEQGKDWLKRNIVFARMATSLPPTLCWFTAHCSPLHALCACLFTFIGIVLWNVNNQEIAFIVILALRSLLNGAAGWISLITPDQPTPQSSQWWIAFCCSPCGILLFLFVLAQLSKMLMPNKH